MTAIATHRLHEPDPRRTYVLWLAVCFAGAQLLTVPYARALTAAATHNPPPDATLVAVSIVLQSTIAYLVARLAVSLGASIGLGWPLLAGWRDDDGTRSLRRALRTLGVSALAGVAAVPFVVGLIQLLQRGADDIRQFPIAPSAVVMASVGAGIQEEILFRLGVMTVAAWLVSRVVRSPGAVAVWSGNVVAALLFGAAHLPVAAALAGLTPARVAFIFAGNGLVGLVCGWLYWRRGLLAAMTAHASFDLVLKVLLPALSSMA